MTTVKYLVDRGVRRAGEVRAEEDGIAEMLIYRGFAEATGQPPDPGTGDGRAVAQYDPEGSEPLPTPQTQDTSGTTPSDLDAPGNAGVNTAPPDDANAGDGADTLDDHSAAP